MVHKISLLAGHGRNGRPESFGRIDMTMGQVVSIVGPTGSGKTTLINDIELFADRDTPTGRRVLINDQPAPQEFRYNPARNPIALITQHTTFLSDLPVREFLLTHSRVRSGGEESPLLVAQAIDFANKLTGEPIDLDNRMTELSGGQTRALLIADATVICSTPVVLLDEVENAGIHRTRAVQLLRQHRKIFIFVTHDPRIALLSDFRIIMQGGCVTRGALHERRRARRIGPREPPGRRPFGPSREAPPGTPPDCGGIAGGRMRVAICAGPATTGKTSVLRHCTRKLLQAGRQVAFLKLDVQFADEDELLAKEFGIPTRKVYTGELCPDHCHVMVLGDALRWAQRAECDVLLVETAGLCLRCAPYVDGGLGLIVLEATSGMNLPLKVGPMLSLADVAVVTKIDRVSQAEREVFRARIQDVAPKVMIREVNALHGIGIDPIMHEVLDTPEVCEPLYLRGNPPVGTCTICVGKKEIGWQSHFGVVRALENQTFYRGE